MQLRRLLLPWVFLSRVTARLAASGLQNEPIVPVRTRLGRGREREGRER